MARVYKCFFEIKIDLPTIWGLGTPPFRNKIAEMCYLYRRTGRDFRESSAKCAHAPYTSTQYMTRTTANNVRLRNNIINAAVQYHQKILQFIYYSVYKGETTVRKYSK